MKSNPAIDNDRSFDVQTLQPDTPLTSQRNTRLLSDSVTYRSHTAHASPMATKTSVLAAVGAMLGKQPDTFRPGFGRILVVDSTEIKEDAYPIVSTRLLMSLSQQHSHLPPWELERLLATANRSLALGFYDAHTQTTTLVANRIKAGSEGAVFLHEMTHKFGRPTLGETAWRVMVDQVKAWHTAAPDTVERKIYNAALRRCAAAKGLDQYPEIYDEELFAYAVESAVSMGVRPNASAHEHSAEHWLATVMASIERVGRKLSSTLPAPLTVQDTVDLAYAMAQMETPAHAELIRHALSSAGLLEPPPAPAGKDDPPSSSYAAPKPQPGWFSPLRQAFEKSATKAATAQHWLEILRGLPASGVKVAEIQWSGVSEWLEAQDRNQRSAKIAKAAVLDYLTDHSIDIQEILLGGNELHQNARQRLAAEGFVVQDAGTTAAVLTRNGALVQTSELTAQQLSDHALMADAAALSDKQTAFQSLQLPGASQYRELLLVLPELPGTLNERAREFNSVHWRHANVLAHVRFNRREDVDGSQILMVEEIQSDWAQQGKKRGMISTETTVEGKTASDWQEEAHRLFGTWTPGDPDPLDRWHHAINTARKLREKYLLMGFSEVVEIPSAPFVTSTDAWVSLALKSVLRYAVENGFNRIAFINGQQSVDRYMLHKRVTSFSWSLNAAGNYALRIESRPNASTFIDKLKAGELHRHIGPKYARLVMDSAETSGEFAGIDYEFGGEGMLYFYDKIVPAVAAELMRKLKGPPIKPFILQGQGTEGAAEARQTGFDISPELRELVMEGSGLPLFSMPAEVTTAGEATDFTDAPSY